MTTNPNTNPLQAWFRQPAIYIRLPSQGQYWPDGSLEMPQNNELGVMPMTALDEINYRTPDALFNGQAVVEVIQSCIPSIKNAWDTPAIDLNSILVSIRIASYGHDMEITSTCPKCEKSNDYSIDMRNMLNTLATPDYTKNYQSGEIEVFFRPMTFRQQTQISMDQFETQRMLSQAQTDPGTDTEKIQRIGDVMKKINQATTRALAFGIAGIRAPNGFVDNPQWITEFLESCDSRTYSGLREATVSLRGQSDIKPVTIICDDCKHQYDQPIEINMSNFFGAAS